MFRLLYSLSLLGDERCNGNNLRCFLDGRPATSEHFYTFRLDPPKVSLLQTPRSERERETERRKELPVIGPESRLGKTSLSRCACDKWSEIFSCIWGGAIDICLLKKRDRSRSGEGENDCVNNSKRTRAREKRCYRRLRVKQLDTLCPVREKHVFFFFSFTRQIFLMTI